MRCAGASRLGRRVYRPGDAVAHRHVVRMAVHTAGIEGDHYVRTHIADRPDQLSDHGARLRVDEGSRVPVLVGACHPGVAVSEEPHVLHAQSRGRGAKLAFPNGTQRLGRRERRVGDLPHLPAGRADDHDPVSLFRGARHHATDAERLVVGVWQRNEERRH